MTPESAPGAAPEYPENPFSRRLCYWQLGDWLHDEPFPQFGHHDQLLAYEWAVAERRFNDDLYHLRVLDEGLAFHHSDRFGVTSRDEVGILNLLVVAAATFLGRCLSALGDNVLDISKKQRSILPMTAIPEFEKRAGEVIESARMNKWLPNVREFALSMEHVGQFDDLAATALREARSAFEELLWEREIWRAENPEKVPPAPPFLVDDTDSSLRPEPLTGAPTPSNVIPPNSAASGCSQTVSLFGTNIRFFRRQCGWTVRDLATAVSISEKQVKRHQAGQCQPRPDTIAEYARAFSEKLGRVLTVADLESRAHPGL